MRAIYCRWNVDFPEIRRIYTKKRIIRYSKMINGMNSKKLSQMRASACTRCFGTVAPSVNHVYSRSVYPQVCEFAYSRLLAGRDTRLKVSRVYFITYSQENFYNFKIKNGTGEFCCIELQWNSQRTSDTEKKKFLLCYTGICCWRVNNNFGLNVTFREYRGYYLIIKLAILKNGSWLGLIFTKPDTVHTLQNH